MNTTIYVDNLALATTESELTALFSTYGNVVNVNLVVDRTSEKPRGFGFVTMVTPEGAQAAIQTLDGKTIGANVLSASEAWPDGDRSNRRKGQRSPRRGGSKLF